MNRAQRLARLEAHCPRDDREWFVRLFSFRVAGLTRVGFIAETLRRLERAIADERATAEQRALWKKEYQRVTEALNDESNRMCAHRDSESDISAPEGASEAPSSSTFAPGPPGRAKVGRG